MSQNISLATLLGQSRELNIMAHEDINQNKSIEKMNFNFGF